MVPAPGGRRQLVRRQGPRAVRVARVQRRRGRAHRDLSAIAPGGPRVAGAARRARGVVAGCDRSRAPGREPRSLHRAPTGRDPPRSISLAPRRARISRIRSCPCPSIRARSKAGRSAEQPAHQGAHGGTRTAHSPGVAPRWLSGKWRLVERDPWWEHDGDERCVVFGHYWRRRPSAEIEDKPDTFSGIAPTAWFGDRGQAFCVDYSVGYRLKGRHFGHDPHRNYGLAALRWPERLLVFDDEEAPVATTGARR
jgi:hypothetical protein